MKFLIYLKTGTDNKNAFSVFRTDKKNVKVIIHATSQEEKLTWMELLNDCIAKTGFVPNS